MDRVVVDKWLKTFPKLETFITAGTISLKMAREILGIDRYYMYDIYLELIVAGAVVGCGSNSFRASTDLKHYILERREVYEL